MKMTWGYMGDKLHRQIFLTFLLLFLNIFNLVLCLVHDHFYNHDKSCVYASLDSH